MKQFHQDEKLLNWQKDETLLEAPSLPHSYKLSLEPISMNPFTLEKISKSKIKKTDVFVRSQSNNPQRINKKKYIKKSMTLPSFKIRGIIFSEREKKATK